MRAALLALAVAAAVASLPRGRARMRPVVRVVRGGRFSTREGAIFALLMAAG